MCDWEAPEGKCFWFEITKFDLPHKCQGKKLQFKCIISFLRFVDFTFEDEDVYPVGSTMNVKSSAFHNEITMFKNDSNMWTFNDDVVYKQSNVHVWDGNLVMKE